MPATTEKHPSDNDSLAIMSSADAASAVAAAFGFLQHRRAVDAAQAEYMARITSVQQTEAHHEATDFFRRPVHQGP
jgi:hypothetical protein